MSFSVGCFYELALLVIALVWNQLFHRPPFANFNWSLKAGLMGVVASIPPLAFLVWTLKTNIAAFSPHKELMERLLRPLMGNWSIWQLAIISICAGVSEEALFRGGIQGGLAERIGVGPALALASLAFGFVHLITWTYAIIATFIGAYLGLLWIWTGNLFAPMVNHAVYDFLALVYFLKVYRS
jgi:membrane protease YdiL (CAAX protease family)